MNVSKAVDIKYFWLSDKIEEGDIELKWTDTDDLIADGLTKPLTGTKFRRWRDRILNIVVADPADESHQEAQGLRDGSQVSTSKKRRKVDPSTHD